jgi:hypothetical protein
VSGAIGWGTTKDPEWQAFHQMNLAWGAVNTGLAINGLVAALHPRRRPASLAAALRAETRKQTFFGVMVGLDVAYMTTGALLWARGVERDDPRSLGFGRSLLLQGGGLLIFDLAMMIAHGQLGSDLWVSLSVAPTAGIQLGGRF